MKPYKLKKFIRLCQAEKDLLQAADQYQKISIARDTLLKMIQERRVKLGEGFRTSMADEELLNMLEHAVCDPRPSRSAIYNYVSAVWTVRP